MDVAVQGPVVEQDLMLREQMNIDPKASILKFVQVSHVPRPVTDMTTIIKIEGPPKKPRQSNAGRKPRKRPKIRVKEEKGGVSESYKSDQTVEEEEKCKSCGRAGCFEVDEVRGDIVCRECGVVDSQDLNRHLDFDDQTHVITPSHSFQEPTPSIQGSCYDCANHFRDVLMQCQGIENMKLSPPNILERMRTYMKEHMINPESLHPKDTYRILRHLGFTHMYQHKHQITYMLSGKRPYLLSKEMVEQLCLDFQKVLVPLRILLPVFNRKNLPSYYFILFKLCELREHYDLCSVIYLLKTNNKNNVLERIWKIACKYLGPPYVYIPSPTFSDHHK